MVYEVEEGARDFRMEGGYAPAVTATPIRQPAGKSLLSHVQYFLEKRELKVLCWLDTRDGSAAWLTKGVVSRDVLREIMDGAMRLQS